jgi:hypothetical protein
MPYESSVNVFCSFSDSRSWTNPITNLSTVSRAHTASVLRQLLTDYLVALPDDVFPPLIHEACHHSFFATSAFSALANLRLTASANLLSEKNATLGVKQMKVYKNAMTILRPLAEGAAMFAECDVKSSLTSPLTSLALGSVMDLLGAYGELQDLHRLLTSARITREMLDRKVNLLTSPIHSSGGGYAMGYLALKCLWLHATGKSESDLTWDESDRWLRYVKKFFLEDPGLLMALLDLSGSVNKVTSRIATALADRFTTFFLNFDPEVDLKIFEDHADDDEILPEDGFVSFSHSVELCKAPHISPKKDRRAREMFRQSLSGLLPKDSSAVGSLERLLDEFAPSTELGRNILGNTLIFSSMIHSNRNDFHAASVPVEASISETLGVTLSIAGETVFDYEQHEFGINLINQLPDGCEPGKPYEGRVDVFIPAGPEFAAADVGPEPTRLILISIGIKPITLEIYGGATGRASMADYAYYKERVTFAFRARYAFSAMDRVAVARFEKLSGSPSSKDEDKLFKLTDGVYLPWVKKGIGSPSSVLVKPPMEDEGLRKLRKRNMLQIRKSGVLELFGSDRKLIEGLALLGLCNSVEPSYHALEDAFRSLGLSVNEVIEKIASVNESVGVPRIMKYKDSVMSIL